MKYIDINFIDFTFKKGHPITRCLVFKYKQMKRKRKTYKQYLPS